MRTLFLIALLALTPAYAHAAELSVTPPLGPVHAGDTFTVDVVLDPAGTTVNALEGVVTVSSNLRIKSVKTNASIIPLWADGPRIIGDAVQFAGVIPGGYAGSLGPDWIGYRPDTAFTLVLSARAPGVASVALSGARVLANDGNGTELPLKALGLDMAVLPSNGINAVPAFAIDSEKPEPFTVSVADGKPFNEHGVVLVFSATDKDSGIIGYEVAHSGSLLSESDALSLSWEEAVSPYPVPGGEADQYHYIKAVDGYGNARVATVPPVESGAVRVFWWIMLIGALGLVGIVFLHFRRRRI